MDYNSPSKPDAPTTPPGEPFPDQGHPAAESPYHYQEMKQDRKHSGPGIASFIISLVTLIGYIIAFVIVGAMASSIIDEAGNLIPDSSQAIMFLGMAVLALAALNVIGVVVGIIGLALQNRRKVFGIIGTIINGVIIILFMLLISTVLVNAGTL